MGEFTECPYCGIIFISNFGHNCDGMKIDPDKRLNLHRDHIASCLCCSNLMVSNGYPDLSDITPGEPPSCYCSDGHFNVDKLGWEELIRTLHAMGRTCFDFEAKD
jgi:hypothetical protein